MNSQHFKEKLLNKMKFRVFAIFLSVFTSTFSIAQKVSIEGSITGNQYQWVFIEEYEGYKLNKVDSAWCNASGAFTMEFEPRYMGLHRFSLGRGQGGGETRFFDLLIDGKPIQFSTNLTALSDSLKFKSSGQQIYFQKFVQGIGEIKWKQYLLDEFLIKYPMKDPFYPKAAEAFDRVMREKSDFFKSFKDPKYPLANQIIKMAEPFEFTDMRDPSVKGKFFPDMDFNNPLLLRSNILAQKIGEYYQHFAGPHSDMARAALENKSFIDQVLDPMSKHPALWDNTFEYMAQAFKSMKNDEALEYLKQKYTDLGGCEDDQQAKSIDDLLASFNALRPGSLVIPFVLPDAKGQNFSFPQQGLGSKVTLLIFWSSSCSHCVSTLPYWENLWQDYKGKGLNIVAIGMENRPDRWRTEIEKPKRDWVQLIDKDSWEGVAREYNINATPSYVLVDAQGKVILKPHNPEQIKDWLKKELK